MTDVPDRRYLLAAARAEFLEGADPDLRGVPDHVAASWRRSVSSGVQPGSVATEYFADLDLGSRLVRCARPVIEQLAEQMADVPMCVALTDSRARLLARRDSSSWFGRVADRVYFAQGFGYAEDAVGTNGVGTVLEFGESVHIVGPEHFVESLQPFACAGAPIRDPFTGRIEGVLDVSCLRDHSSPIMHSLVRSAAARIEHNLLTDRDQVQQALFDAYIRAEARSREAILAVGPRLMLANSAMQTLLGPVDQEALQGHVRFLTRRRTTVDERVDLPSGVRVRLRGSTVTLGQDVAGIVGVVSPVHEVDSAMSPLPAVLARAPRTPAAPSACPAWRAAAATVATALRDGVPVLVLGEPGSGRLAMLRHCLPDPDRIVPIEPGAVDAAPGAVAARLRDPGTALPVLRDVHRLSGATVHAVVTALRDAPPVGGGWAATATDDGRLDGRHAPLFALLRASATVPPLRHRAVDLPSLVGSLLGELAPHRDVRVSPDAMRALSRHGWPGNVRELREVLAEALRRRPVGCIEASDLPASCQSTPRSALRPVDEVERDAIVTALRDAGGNRVAAAAALGLARSTLYRKIRQYGITA
jgi:sigma-54 dependent transcriptional regulator, acetoin dehydrogenase operon transcriptional activator AcoR